VPRESELAPLLGGLLVGGESRRFGRPKALATWRGSSLAECAAAALTAVAPEVVLLGGGPSPLSLSALRRLADAPGARGPLAGILGALGAHPDRALLVAACDQPLLSVAALRWLVGLRRPGAIAVVARLGGAGIEPLPGLYEPAARPVLEALARGGGSLQPLGDREDVLAPTPPAGLAAAWTSVDTPERLAELERPPAR
jgi:molybdopterin-guanine dinucleotide biosynthesis protein A